MPALLAVIPHPDDESYSFAGTIALASRAGWECHIESASRGEGGKRHDHGPTDRRNVGAVRAAEMAASCRVLGAHPPHFWNLPDGRLQEQPDQSARIAAIVRRLDPAVVLALGADGAYGHPDHIALYRWLVAAWASLRGRRPHLLLAAFPPGLFVPQWEKCLPMMGDPPSPAADALGTSQPDYEVPIVAVACQKRDSIAAHRSQLPGGAPEDLFPPGIISALMSVERFVDAAGRRSTHVASLLEALAAGVPEASARNAGTRSPLSRPGRPDPDG